MLGTQQVAVLLHTDSVPFQVIQNARLLSKEQGDRKLSISPPNSCATRMEKTETVEGKIDSENYGAKG